MAKLSSHFKTLKQKIDPVSAKMLEKIAEIGMEDLAIHKIDFAVRGDDETATGLHLLFNDALTENGITDLVVDTITFGPLPPKKKCPDGQHAEWICKGLKCVWTCVSDE